MSKQKNYFLTIDVGTVNLAYCLAEHDSKQTNIIKSINIVDWGILDVSYKPLYCKQIKNKRAICNCISKFYQLKPEQTDHSNPENLIGLCKTHAKPIQTHNKTNKKDKQKIYKISENPIYKNNFNIQMERLLRSLENFYQKIILNPYDIDSDGTPQYVENLRIYIENQPVFKNPIMKSLSVGIYTFFCMKKILYPKKISTINFINATVKTKQDFISQLNDLVGIKSKIKDFKSYAKRKDFSEDIVRQIIPQLSYSRKYINNIISTSNYAIVKKKDDLADTLLYQLYVIIYLI